MSCIIEGFVFLTCQRSLEAFRHEVAIDDRLVLVGSEEELPAIEEEGDEEDYVVATEPARRARPGRGRRDPRLPMVPRKPGLEPEPEAGREGEGKPSPFAALAGLKRPGTK